MATNSNQYLYFAVVIIGLNGIMINSAPSNLTATDLTASRFLEYMDKDVDPCNNFYKFACGNFLKTAVILNSRKTLNAIESVEDKVQRQLIDILEKPISSNELQPLKFIKEFYTRCLDQKTIDERGIEPLLQLFKRLGGWPVIEGEQWNDKTWTWNDFTHRCRENGITESLFIDLTVKPSPIDSKKSIIHVPSSDIFTSKYRIEPIDEEKEYNANHKYMIDVVKLVLGDKIKDFDEKLIKKCMTEVLKFTEDLQKITEKLKYDESIYNPMTIKNMTKMWSSIQWLDYFRKLLPANVVIDENEIINVVQPEYLTEFEKLIEKTPKRVQANFGIWNAFITIVEMLPTPIQKLQKQQYKSSGLNYPFASRNEYCFTLSNALFSVGIDALYVREYFDEKTKKNVDQILTNIRTQLHNLVEKIEWMDEETKQNSLKKANTITSVIAFPDELLNDEKLENYFSSLKVDCKNFLECYLNSYVAVVDRKLYEMKLFVDGNYWFNNKLEHYISYSRNDNKITIPIGILQDMVYGKERPNYTNYAVLGSSIAEKLLSIIVDEENSDDEDEGVNELWTESTRKQFKKKTKCLVDQYNNYFVDEVNMTLNGDDNLPSNIERHEGLKLAYAAYNNWVIENDVEGPLPGFDSTFTPKKLFWISFANANCIRFDPNYLKRFIELGRRIPPEFQINGALSDIPEFAQDFKCPKGSPMIRNDICAV